ncbi:hypothetical protein Tsp_09668 [Trichinella spiralis]|uniref:hypothetical protein n=1 Tax=Trichinella spiralis TaxID=6334 RepID=UPI0001EFD31F|nr:hypothetical protein Tsp_09668 [Trichinella spiralis]
MSPFEFVLVDSRLVSIGRKRFGRRFAQTVVFNEAIVVILARTESTKLDRLRPLVAVRRLASWWAINFSNMAQWKFGPDERPKRTACDLHQHWITVAAKGRCLTDAQHRRGNRRQRDQNETSQRGGQFRPPTVDGNVAVADRGKSDHTPVERLTETGKDWRPVRPCAKRTRAVSDATIPPGGRREICAKFARNANRPPTKPRPKNCPRRAAAKRPKLPRRAKSANRACRPVDRWDHGSRD